MARLFQQVAKGRKVNPMASVGFMNKESGLKPGSKDTRDWFRARAAHVLKINPNRMIKGSSSTVTRFQATNLGKMYMFMYDPKHKDTLPYWDKFPLIFVIEGYSDGFLGINLHYLPPQWRAKLMDALYSTINNKKYDDTTKLKLTYDILRSSSRMRMFGPCVKRYLYSHVRSNIAEVESADWDYAMMLPMQRFQGASSEQVWRDSVKRFQN